METGVNWTPVIATGCTAAGVIIGYLAGEYAGRRTVSDAAGQLRAIADKLESGATLAPAVSFARRVGERVKGGLGHG